jgi:hypothetical protein
VNQFDTVYFSKYVSEGDELLFVCHRHPILIVDTLLLWCFFGVLLPVFFYLHNTFWIADGLSSGYFELYLLGIYLALVYQVFDWYNDAWIITNRGIIDVQWRYFTGDVQHLGYESIHGIEVKSDSIFDSLLGKGDIWLHLVSEREEFVLTDAINPQWIVEYIQAVIDEMKHEHETPVDDRAPFELLLDTLTEMVREHLQKWGSRIDGNDHNSAEEARILERALRRRSTIDLRDPEPAFEAQDTSYTHAPTQHWQQIKGGH